MQKISSERDLYYYESRIIICVRFIFLAGHLHKRTNERNVLPLYLQILDEHVRTKSEIEKNLLQPYFIRASPFTILNFFFHSAIKDHKNVLSGVLAKLLQKQHYFKSIYVILNSKNTLELNLRVEKLKKTLPFRIFKQ